MSTTPTATTLVANTWTIIAEFAAPNKPKAVEITHLGDHADGAWFQVEPTHLDNSASASPAAPATVVGRWLPSGQTRDHIEVTDSSGAGAITRVWARSTGTPTIVCGTSAA